jgi:hypothetical protein
MSHHVPASNVIAVSSVNTKKIRHDALVVSSSYLIF